MFPQQSDDFWLQYDLSNHQQNQSASLEKETNLTNNKIEKQNILSSPKNINSDYEKKKITHKEIERQRRLHISMLHASLRSLLPLEYIQGKRSISDHMNEAVNYINFLKKNVQDLIVKRDKLKKLSDLEGSAGSDNCLRNCTVTVTASPNWGGVEIMISNVIREDLILSRVLKVVVEEGLDVVRCVSTQTNDGFFHTIQSEVGDMICVDIHGLQQKLNDVVIISQLKD